MDDGRNAYAYSEMLDEALERVRELEDALDDAIASLACAAEGSSSANAEVDALRAILTREWR